MKIAVLGSSGYIGHNLIEKLLNETNHQIFALSPNATKVKINNKKLNKVNVDVFDTNALSQNIKDCDAVYYLIHMMAQKQLPFALAEAKAAQSLVNATKGTKVKKIIYLGGLGNDNEQLSEHLASRHHTGEVLRQAGVQVIEFRASMIIGDGSISYDIIKNLVHKLPVLTLPKWSGTLTQPIGLNDTLEYLLAALNIGGGNHIIEIGGPEQLTYKQLMERYAKWKVTPAYFIVLPLIPAGIAGWWLNLFTPRRHAKVGRIMVDSLANPMVVTNKKSQELFPAIKPQKLEQVFV